MYLINILSFLISKCCMYKYKHKICTFIYTFIHMYECMCVHTNSGLQNCIISKLRRQIRKAKRNWVIVFCTHRPAYFHKYLFSFRVHTQTGTCIYSDSFRVIRKLFTCLYLIQIQIDMSEYTQTIVLSFMYTHTFMERTEPSREKLFVKGDFVVVRRL